MKHVGYWSVAALACALTALLVITAGDQPPRTATGDQFPPDALELEGHPEIRPDPPSPIPRQRVIGSIDQVDVAGQEVTVIGWAADRSGRRPPDFELLLDGQPITAVDLVTRPDIAAAMNLDRVSGFTTTVKVGPGAHRICIRDLGSGDVAACERVAGSEHLGVLVSRTGVALPVLEERPDGWLVTTPCSQVVMVARGTHVRTAQIVIDPGHGGRESSTVAPNGLLEKDVNLDVALKLRDELTERGYSVVMTRVFDHDVPLAKRADIANAVDPDLFVSVHHNGGAISHKSVPGTQVFYQSTDDESRRVAGVLYEELFAAAVDLGANWRGTSLDGASTRLTSSGDDFYGIHRRTPDVVSVITEWMWLDNPSEAALLARDDIRQREADALAQGIDRWYQTLDRGSGYVGAWVDDFSAGSVVGCKDPPL